MRTPIILLSIILLLSITSCCKKTTEVNLDLVSTPVFSPGPYMFNPGVQVAISCATPGADIRYTTNGQYTHAASLTYTGPITVDSTMTIKAVAYYRTHHSEIATATFVIYQNSLSEYQFLTNMSATPDTIFADNGLTSSTVSVKVVDAMAFGIPGQLVEFHTTLGHIRAGAVTDSTGVARAVLTADNVSGIARVTAITRKHHPDYPDFVISADTATVDVTIQSPPPEPVSVHYLRFTQSGQIDLNVMNTGGMDAAYLRVKLYDSDGNLFTEPRNVWFRILNPGASGGANLNNQSPADSVMAVSNNGIAQVLLYSGTANGNIVVKASCTDNGRYHETVKDNIVVHAGPAYRIEVFGGGYNTGENMGGGMWRIVVGARCYDLYDNPVSYGTSVWFQIIDNEYNCQIGAAAYIGNNSVYGDNDEGTAYTYLIYSGVYSGLPVTIRASSGGYNGSIVSGEATIILPVNQPQLELLMVPGNLVFRGNTNPNPPSATAEPQAVVYDGQGCPIPYTNVTLVSTRGVFEYTTGSNTNPEHYNPQGNPNIIVTNPNGYAEGLIRFYAYEIPYADPMTGNASITIATVTAYLLGSNVSASSSIYLIRYPT